MGTIEIIKRQSEDELSGGIQREPSEGKQTFSMAIIVLDMNREGKYYASNAQKENETLKRGVKVNKEDVQSGFEKSGQVVQSKQRYY